MGRDAPHAVYRCWDAAERLLYVGRSKRPEERWEQHQRNSHWASSVAYREVEWLPGYVEALEAELTAIQQEKPLHNVHGAYVKPPADTVRLSTRVTACLREFMTWEAEMQGRSMEDVIDNALRHYLEETFWKRPISEIAAVVRRHRTPEQRAELARLLTTDP